MNELKDKKPRFLQILSDKTIRWIVFFKNQRGIGKSSDLAGIQKKLQIVCRPFREHRIRFPEIELFIQKLGLIFIYNRLFIIKSLQKNKLLNQFLESLFLNCQELSIFYRDH